MDSERRRIARGKKKSKAVDGETDIMVPSDSNRNIYSVTLSKLRPDREGGQRNDSVSRVRPDLPTSRLVTPKRDWPPIKSIGLEMVRVGSYSDKMFAYHYKQQYQDIQKLDTHPVSHLPVDLTAKEPWYVKSLLFRCYQSFKARDFETMSNDLQRALYMLEFSAAPSFQFTGGLNGCKISYNIYENRQLFLALFYRAALASMKDEYDVAFEVCKLLLSFQPDQDDMGVVLLLELCALKLLDYQYLIDFYFFYQDSDLFATYPTVLYSSALAMVRLQPHSPYARKVMVKAVERLPVLGARLLEKVAERTSTSFSGLGEIGLQLGIKFSRTDKMLTVMYLHRCSPFWCDDEAGEACNLLADILQTVASGWNNKKEGKDVISVPLLRHLYLSNHQSALLKYVKGAGLSEQYVLSPLHCYNPFPMRGNNIRATRKIFNSGSGVLREDSNGKLCVEVDLYQLTIPHQVLYVTWEFVRTFLPFKCLKKATAVKEIDGSAIRLIFTPAENEYQVET